MAFSVEDEATDAAVRRLAKIKNKDLAETIREAVEKEYAEINREDSLVDRLGRLGDRLAAYPSTGLKADKAFFDDLGGNL